MDMSNSQAEIIIYKAKDGLVHIEIERNQETIWLSQSQIALLFGTQRPAITKHLNNIFKTKELDKKQVCSKMERTANDGKTYKTQFYNLDAILSIGYRVNSQKATEFRIWATKTLNQHLLQGYTLNEKKLLAIQERFNDLQKAITFLQEKSRKALLGGQAEEILSLLAQYAKTLNLLEAYDQKKLRLPKGKTSSFVLTYEQCVKIVVELKKALISKGEASELFGFENNQGLKAIIENLYQTFDNNDLYPTIEDRAAHLLYFIIKDHPFTDGNKRIASFLFVYFLDQLRLLYHNGEQCINDNALTALALLVAESDPKEKEVMVKLIINLISHSS